MTAKPRLCHSFDQASIQKCSNRNFSRNLSEIQGEVIIQITRDAHKLKQEPNTKSDSTETQSCHLHKPYSNNILQNCSHYLSIKNKRAPWVRSSASRRECAIGHGRDRVGKAAHGQLGCGCARGAWRAVPRALGEPEHLLHGQLKVSGLGTRAPAAAGHLPPARTPRAPAARGGGAMSGLPRAPQKSAEADLRPPDAGPRGAVPREGADRAKATRARHREGQWGLRRAGRLMHPKTRRPTEGRPRLEPPRSRPGRRPAGSSALRPRPGWLPHLLTAYSSSVDSLLGSPRAVQQRHSASGGGDSEPAHRPAGRPAPHSAIFAPSHVLQL